MGNVARVRLLLGSVDDKRSDSGIVDLRVHPGEASLRASETVAYDPNLRVGGTRFEQRPATVALAGVLPRFAGSDHELREVLQVWIAGRSIGRLCCSVGDDRNRHLAHAVRGVATFARRTPTGDS